MKKKSRGQMGQLRHENQRLKKRNRRLDQRLEQLEEQKRQWEEQKQQLEEQKRQLEEEKRHLQSQLMEYRQKFFKPKAQANEEPTKTPKKRGAPIGHPGTTRKTPDRYDEHLEVTLKECPECGSTELRLTGKPEDHYQEDIVLPKVLVTRYRHHSYHCQGCGKVVKGVGQGEHARLLHWASSQERGRLPALPDEGAVS